MSDGVGVGYGARPIADGIDAVYFVAQENYPVEFLEPAIRCGCGATRSTATAAAPGGSAAAAASCANTRCWRSMPSSRCASTAWSTRPGASRGGMQGGTGRAVVNPGTPTSGCLRRSPTARCCAAATSCARDRRRRRLRAIRSIAPAEQVLHDVRDGFVSIEAARRDYGVVIGDGRACDHAATASLRASDRSAAKRVPPQGLRRRDRLTCTPLRSISAAPSPTSRWPIARPGICGAPRRRARRPIRRKPSSPA